MITMNAMISLAFLAVTTRSFPTSLSRDTSMFAMKQYEDSLEEDLLPLPLSPPSLLFPMRTGSYSAPTYSSASASECDDIRIIWPSFEG